MVIVITCNVFTYMLCVKVSLNIIFLLLLILTPTQKLQTQIASINNMLKNNQYAYYKAPKVSLVQLSINKKMEMELIHRDTGKKPTR